MDKWEILAYVFAVINPVFPGILMGIALYMDSNRRYHGTGRNVIIVSIIMAALYAIGVIRLGILKVP